MPGGEKIDSLEKNISPVLQGDDAWQDGSFSIQVFLKQSYVVISFSLKYFFWLDTKICKYRRYIS